VYETFLSGAFPARATVQISVLPRGALVEIDALACR
jgi:enamine deaminase RidA (YjgF/YER057c/UK114 family)